MILKAEIPDGSHIYALTQTGNPNPSKITVTDSEQFKVGKFAADRSPKVIEKDPLFNNRIEKHLKLVQFFAEFKIKPGVDPSTIKPEIVFNGQVCSDAGMCMPLRNKKITAVFAGYYEQQAVKPTKSRNPRR